MLSVRSHDEIKRNVTDTKIELALDQRGFIAQSVEHRTGIAEVMGLNPVGASDFFFWDFFATV